MGYDNIQTVKLNSVILLGPSKEKDMTFQQWLQTEVELSGLDMKILAQKVGVSTAYLSMLRRGKRNPPSADVRAKIHKVLSDLSGGREVPAPPIGDKSAVPTPPPSRILFSSEVIQMALGMIATVGGDSVSKEELDLLLRVCHQIHSRRKCGGST